MPFFHVRICAKGCLKVPLRLHYTLLIFPALVVLGNVARWSGFEYFFLDDSLILSIPNAANFVVNT